MRVEELQKALAKAQATVRALQDELAETNRGLMALTMELEQRVDDRTADLRAVHDELTKTNSELMQMTLELEDRVAQRTTELNAANETLRQSHIGALNMMEDAIAARSEAEHTSAVLQMEVTERKRAEAMLLESESRYRMLFESAQDGIALANAETGILADCNRSLCQTVEREKAELVGQPQSILYPPQNVADAQSPTCGHCSKILSPKVPSSATSSSSTPSRSLGVG